jgi:large subunit ribosomal protein L21
MMFAVIKAGGKQYRVAANDQISIVTLHGEAGDQVAFDHVLMLSQDGVTTVGAPTVAGVTVAGEIVEQTRGDKVIAFKKRRRQNSKRKRGFRSEITIVRITDILTGGAKPAAKAKVAKPEADADVAVEKPAKAAKAPKAKAVAKTDAPAAE